MNSCTGWICPKCGKVYAPWVSSCDCSTSVSTTLTSVSKCKHSWLPSGMSTAGNIYTCEFCGAHKTEPINNM